MILDLTVCHCFVSWGADFFAKRRRSTTTTTTETKCAQSAFHEGGAETALCKTIR